jgi:branched-chain amino acid transport system ATP-binding protein
VSALLEIAGLDAGYGDFQALYGIDLRVAESETVAVIGANGAGKTTLLRTLAGLVDATAGSVRFAGDDLLAVPHHRRVDLGIALVPEGRHLFPSLTVHENLLVGAHARRSGTWDVDRVVDVFPLVGPLLRRPAGVLSGGEQQAVAIGRALMANPDLLLLDEVSLGLAPIVVRDLYAAIPGIKAAGTTVVIVEQDVTLALEIADHAYCMLEGRVTLSGPPAELTHEAVTDAYFGVTA